MDAAKLADLKRRWEADRTSRIFLQLAEEYRRLGRPAEALPVLEEGLLHHAAWLAAQVALGRCRLEAGHPQGASAALEGVLRRDPTQMVAYRLLVAAYLAMGEVKAAQERLDLYRELNPQDPELEDLQRRVHRTAAISASPPPPPPPPLSGPVPGLAGTTMAGPGALASLPVTPMAPIARPDLTPPPPAMPARQSHTPPPIVVEPVYEPPSQWGTEDTEETEETWPRSAAEPSPPPTLWPLEPGLDPDLTFDLLASRSAAPLAASVEPQFEPRLEPSFEPAAASWDPHEGSPWDTDQGPPPEQEVLQESDVLSGALETPPLASSVSVSTGRHGEPFVMSPLQHSAPDLRSLLLVGPPRALRRRNGAGNDAPNDAPNGVIAGGAPTAWSAELEPIPAASGFELPPAVVPESAEEYEITEVAPEIPLMTESDSAPAPFLEAPLAAPPPPEPLSWLGGPANQPEAIPFHSFGTGSPFDLLTPGPAESAPGGGDEGGQDAETVTLGSLYQQQGHADEARRIFESVLREDPANQAAQVGLTELGDQGGATAGHEAPPEPGAAERLLHGYRPTYGDGLSEKKAYVLRSYLERLQQSRRDDVP